MSVDNFVRRFAQKFHTVSSGMLKCVQFCVGSYTKNVLNYT